jgi:hypothetical protein
MWDFVDKFVVIEAGETHTGLKKGLKFDHERFKPWASKIIYRSFDSFDEEIPKYPWLLDSFFANQYGVFHNGTDWRRDFFQFNYIYKILLDEGAVDSDIVYYSCLDEILRRSAFEKCLPLFEDQSVHGPYQLRPIVFFHMWQYAYKVNLLRDHWANHYIGTLTEFSNFKKALPHTIRQAGLNTHKIQEDCGWHFTFLDSTDGEMVLEKQRAWSHSRDIIEGQKVKFEHTSKEEALERLFKDYPVTMVELKDETHPTYLIKNLDKFENLIYKGKL